MRKIITSYVFPPISCSHFDWSAIYDGYEGGDIMGTGSTEQKAIDDLISQGEEE